MKKTVPIPMKVHIIIFLIPVVVIAALSLVLPSKPDASAEPRSVRSEQFNLVWTQPDVYAGEFLAIREDCVLFVDYADFNLKCLNVNSGHLVWEFHYPRLGPNITTSESTIFITSAVTGERDRCNLFLREFTPQCDSIQFTAYDVASGQTKWSEVHKGMGTVYELSADETTLEIEGGGGHGSYDATMSIDAETGVLLAYQELEGLTLWPKRQDFPDFIEERDDIVSNVAVMDGVFYFLTADSTLWAIDETAGATIATASFQPTQTLLALHDTYRVAANQGTIAVYFKDSQQLFVLKPIYEAGETARYIHSTQSNGRTALLMVRMHGGETARNIHSTQSNGRTAPYRPYATLITNYQLPVTPNEQ